MTAKKSNTLVSKSISDLVTMFERLSLEQAEAYANFETSKTNRIIMRRYHVVAQLRHRGTDERTALFALYSHRHPQVRLNVAKSTYALNPERALTALQEIAASNQFPWAGDAGMSLALLADGTSLLPSDPELR